MDRTFRAAARQLQGMSCESYEVGIRDAGQGRMMHRQWNAGQVLQSLGFLRSMNASGNDIYIRPSSSEGLLLVDDIGIGTLRRMDEDGCNPAAIIQTSPQNFQAWVRVHRGELDPDLATQAAKLLAERYGGDTNSADWRHYGRLAGFTNRKPEYRSPYVLAERCNARDATRSADILAEASRRLTERQKYSSATTPPSTPLDTSPRPLKRDLDPIRYATDQYHALAQRYGAEFDESRADFMVASDLLEMGLSASQVSATLEQTSPNLLRRKEGHVADYLERTIVAAYRQLQERGIQR
ncbi:DNA topoisomerase [Cyanosarcina cf. burmensis CCALA 770]|nr:DNA topoisomerase [Cyanosarcina cf. burmensis CCALA 770]